MGPREQPPDPRIPFAVAPDMSAARYYVVFSTDPLGSSGIDTLESLQAAMPGLVSEAGLTDVRVGYAGDTAIAAFTVGRTIGDLGRVGLAVIVIDIILLALFLRSLAAPLYLVAASVLALAAALGATTYFFRLLSGPDGLTYYVPFAASVLLISLGSDYTIFVVGRIWEERKVRPLRGAIETAVPKARSAVSVAAVTLALSFSMLAIVDLWSFRQLAVPPGRRGADRRLLRALAAGARARRPLRAHVDRRGRGATRRRPPAADQGRDGDRSAPGAPAPRSPQPDHLDESTRRGAA